MIILAIDTTTEYSSLALLDSNRLIAEFNWLCRQNHSTELAPGVEMLLDKANLSIKDIEAVGVAIGPGNFNGLRVGLSVAKGIAYSLNIPIKGVSSFKAIAFEYALPEVQIVPAIKTSRGQIAAAFYEFRDGKLIETNPPLIEHTENFTQQIGEKSLFCGDIDHELRSILSDKLGADALFAPSIKGVRHAATIARMAGEAILAGNQDNISSLEPDYLKPPYITKPKDKKTVCGTADYTDKAVIWDMDGVIVNSASFHLKAWQEAAKSVGASISEEYFWKTFGIKNSEIVAGLGLSLNQKQETDLIKTKESLFRQMIKGAIKPLPGAIELILELKKHKTPMAVASSAPLENLKCILNELEIRRYFKAIVGEEDVKQGKPDPEVFIKAAGLLAVSPQKCVVIEDAIPGIEGAKKAGMACLAVAGTAPADRLTGADRVVTSLEQIQADELLELIK